MRLKEIREAKGFTQQYVAKCMQCTASAYARYERGEREPSNEMLKRLSKFFGVTTDYLLCNDCGE